MEYELSSEEYFVARYWPADPNGVFLFASKMPVHDQVSCACGQLEIDQNRELGLPHFDNCWEVSQYETLCKVSAKYAEALATRNQLISEMIAAKLRGYHGNTERIKDQAKSDLQLQSLISEVEESFAYLEGENELGF